MQDDESESGQRERAEKAHRKPMEEPETGSCRGIVEERAKRRDLGGEEEP